jgi:hypothetical protein
MTKMRKKASKPHIKAPDAGSITFSTRFTEEQRDRIVEAASLRGWTPSSLMRIAANEKAVHILNISKPTRFDFRDVASRVANQLFAPQIEVYSAEDNEIRIEPLLDLDGDEAKAARWQKGDIDALKNATRLGGAEFLSLIIEECVRIASPDSESFPEPIEPS